MSECEKMRAHKVCILCSLFILSISYYEKMCVVIKMKIFSIIYNCSTSCYIISAYWHQSAVTGMATNKT